MSTLRFALVGAALRDVGEGDGVQMSLAQLLARSPRSAASVLSPRWGEGAGQADGGRQGGGAVGTLALGVPLPLPAGDRSLGGGGVWDLNAERSES